MQFITILIIGRFIVLSTFTQRMVSGSLYDPHVFPRQGPFFEGWYMRISDLNTGDLSETSDSVGTKLGTGDSVGTKLGTGDSVGTNLGTGDSVGTNLGTRDSVGTNLGTGDSVGTRLGTSDSIGLIFGIVLPPANNNISAPLIIASVLFRDCEDIGTRCRLVSIDGKFSPEDLNLTVKGQAVSVDPDQTSPANFTWHASDGTNSAYFEQNGGKTVFRYEIDDLIVSGEANGPVPWDSAGSGPEGWLVNLPLPLHWFVYSLRSDLSFYKIKNITSGVVINRNHGAVHLEKNWGNSFPKEWIWSEGVSTISRNASFAIAGGLVDFHMFPINAFLIGYRNPALGLSLDFRPDNSVITTYINGCKGVVTLTVNSLFYSLNISIFAPMDTFSTCLIGPKSCGFVHACVESYDATAIFKIYKRSLIPFGLTLIDQQSFQYSALEFGGTYVCDNKCSDPC